MSIGFRTVTITAAALCASLIVYSALAADATPAPVAATVLPQALQLGTVKVTGVKVYEALRAIKKALKAPDSTDAEHRNDLVCHFVRELADPRTYLDCATNATNQQRRSQTQMSRMGPSCISRTCSSNAEEQTFLGSLVATQPGERLHIQVNPYDFKKMMEAAAAATVVTVPTADTTPAPAAATRD
jgi:hypothetical protein